MKIPCEQRIAPLAPKFWGRAVAEVCAPSRAEPATEWGGVSWVLGFRARHQDLHFWVKHREGQAEKPGTVPEQ